MFFGYAEDTSGDAIRLKRARMCQFWSADMHGIMGLASMGPSATCRIGPPADIELRKISAVISVTADAVARWEAAPWSK